MFRFVVLTVLVDSLMLHGGAVRQLGVGCLLGVFTVIFVWSCLLALGWMCTCKSTSYRILVYTIALPRNSTFNKSCKPLNYIPMCKSRASLRPYTSPRKTLNPIHPTIKPSSRRHPVRASPSELRGSTEEQTVAATVDDFGPK